MLDGDHRRAAAAASEIRPPHGARIRRQLRPGHAGRAALRAEPAADDAARGAFRHRQRAGREAARGMDTRRPRRGSRLHRLPRPEAGPGGRRNWSSREVEDPGTHVTVILPRRSYSPMLGPAAARPHGGQDRRGREPDPAFRRDDRALRRAQPRPGAAGAPGRPGRPGGAGHRGPDQRHSGQCQRRRPPRPRRPGRWGRVAQDNQAAPGAGVPAEQEMKDVRKLRDLVKGRDPKDVPATDEKARAYERPSRRPGSRRSAR